MLCTTSMFPFCEELVMVPTTEQTHILWPWKYLSSPGVLCANWHMRISWINLFFVTIQIIPKAQPHSKAYRSPDLTATVGYLFWVKITDQDAGKDTAGFLESRWGLKMHCWCLNEVISQLYWITAIFATSFSGAGLSLLELVEISGIIHIFNYIAEIRIWPLFSFLVNYQT